MLSFLGKVTPIVALAVSMAVFGLVPGPVQAEEGACFANRDTDPPRLPWFCGCTGFGDEEKLCFEMRGFDTDGYEICIQGSGTCPTTGYDCETVSIGD